MSQKREMTRVFGVILLAFCLMTGVFFVYHFLSSKYFPISSSPNEQFWELQQRYTQQLESKIVRLLEPLAGPGKVRVAIQLELSLKDAHVAEYQKKFTVPPEPSSQQTVSFTNSSEKQIQNLIQKQHISIVVDGNTPQGDKQIYQPRTQRELNTYRRLVESAVGYSPTRGDTLEIQNIPFAEPPFILPFSPLTLLIGLCCLLIVVTWMYRAIIRIYHTRPHTKKHTTFSQDMLAEILDNPDRIISVIRNWIYIPANTHKTDWLPIQKVGILLLALDEKVVKQILIALSDDEVRQVAKTMTTLGVIPPQESARILTELYDAMFSGSAVVGNPERVQQILSDNERSTNLKTKYPLHHALWQELQKIPSQVLASRLVDIRPEIIAYILYQFPTTKATDLLQYFPEQIVSQTLIHLGHIGNLSTATSRKIEEQALDIIRLILDTPQTPSGAEKTSEILSQMSNTPTRRTIMDNISQQDPLLARKLTAQLIRFENFKYWSDKNIQILLKHTLRTTAVEAFAKSSQELRTVLQRNVPERLWAQLSFEIQTKEKQLTEEQILKAQQTMIQTAQTLLQQGEIDI